MMSTKNKGLRGSINGLQCEFREIEKIYEAGIGLVGWSGFAHFSKQLTEGIIHDWLFRDVPVVVSHVDFWGIRFSGMAKVESVGTMADFGTFVRFVGVEALQKESRSVLDIISQEQLQELRKAGFAVVHSQPTKAMIRASWRRQPCWEHIASFDIWHRMVSESIRSQNAEITKRQT